MIKKVELVGEYSIVVENDAEKEKSQLGMDDWRVMFMNKQAVIDHIALLNKALEFWEYE